MLESDTSDADSKLHVEFYENKTELYKGRPFVKIMTPGDMNNIIDQPVREDHKRRFPRQWLYFQMQNAGDVVPGTPLTQWHQEDPEGFTLGQLEEMQVLRFQVVEQVATASDSQLQRVGMGAFGLREKAIAYLKRKATAQSNSEIEGMKAELAALRALLAEQPAKRGPGRPPKDVNVNNDNAAAHAAGDR